MDVARTTFSVLALAATIGPAVEPAAEASRPVPIIAHRHPAVTQMASAQPAGSLPTVTVHAGGADEDALAAWAIDRFEQAGLSLPPLDVYFHPDQAACDGHFALYRGTREGVDHIDLCTRVDFFVLHELAHAWEAHSLGDQRRARFLELRGLQAWSGPGIEWDDQGTEHAASIVAWGLVGRDVRGARTMRHDTVSSLSSAFLLLTGRGPLHQQAFGPFRQYDGGEVQPSSLEWS